MSEGLTLKKLLDARRILEETPDAPVVGIAFSPEAIAIVRHSAINAQSLPQVLNSFYGVPFIVDPRMPGATHQPFYTEKEWRDRVEEQREWEVSHE